MNVVYASVCYLSYSNEGFLFILSRLPHLKLYCRWCTPRNALCSENEQPYWYQVYTTDPKQARRSTFSSSFCKKWCNHRRENKFYAQTTTTATTTTTTATTMNTTTTTTITTTTSSSSSCCCSSRVVVRVVVAMVVIVEAWLAQLPLMLLPQGSLPVGWLRTLLGSLFSLSLPPFLSVFLALNVSLHSERPAI